jgi:molybdate transport system permease protein
MGLILSWARALGEFGATILFAGSLQGRTQTMPLLVYAILERDLGAALWVGLLLIVVAAAALGVVRWMAHALGAREDADPLADV